MLDKLNFYEKNIYFENLDNELTMDSLFVLLYDWLHLEQKLLLLFCFICFNGVILNTSYSNR